MIQTVMNVMRQVGPAGPQEQRTDSFDFTLPGPLTAANAVVLKIDATGTIGSGVWFTGQTPPSGWSMLADSPDWPLNTDDDPAAPRYGLIGTFEGDNPSPRWFFIGDHRYILPIDALPGLPAGPPQPVLDRTHLKLRLAVNEPSPDAETRGILGSGEGHWQVTVQVLKTDGDPSSGTALSCGDLLSLLSAARAGANTRLCPAIGRAKSDRDTDLALVVLGWSVFGGFLGVLATVGGGLAGAHISVLSLPPDPTPPGIAARVVDALATLAGATASAAPAASSGGLGTLIAFWALLIATLIAFSLALAATVVYMNALATFNNAVSRWSALIVSIQDLLDAAESIMCAGIDRTLPTCPSLP